MITSDFEKKWSYLWAAESIMEKFCYSDNKLKFYEF